MTARAIILFLSSYIMYLSPLSAATKLSCSHPELCRMAEIILNENKVEGFSFETLVQIKGDPHEFEPTTNEVKELIKAPVLIAGPVELNPWIKKVNYQRSKIPGVKTINLPIEDADYALYPTANHEALSHFWLYPKIFCALKSDMESQFLKLGFLKAAPKNKSCKDEEIKITSSLKSTLENLKVPVVLTHDALLPLLESLGKNSAGVVAIKGSGHHEEASTASVKKLYDALKAPKVVWVLEDKINVPQNILAKKRSQDLTVNIDTGHSQGEEYFQTLMTLNDKLKALKP